MRYLERVAAKLLAGPYKPNYKMTMATVSTQKRIGVLALQGDYEAHRKAFEKQGWTTMAVKKESELASIDALAMPGGESTAMLKLLKPELKEALISSISAGLPTFATCAGVILLAREVSSPAQESLGLLDIAVERNSYGRQINSFITELELTPELTNRRDSSKIEGVFIRAPRITAIGGKVQVLAQHQSDPVLIRQGNILAATFHPEISEKADGIYQFFDSLVN